MKDILVGRQQILDTQMQVFAYEILFRGKDFDLSEKEGATSATNQILTDTLLEIGLNSIVGSSKAFVNFTAQNILEKTPLNLPKDRVVIEVLEDVTVDLRIINNLREFSQQGYTIALDDFVFTNEWLPLIEFADIVKLDVMAMPLADTLLMIEKLKPYKIKLLAEKVETLEEFNALKEAGCELFQGFFFSKPNIVAGKRLGVNQTSAIRLLGAVNKSDVEFDELTQIISEDVGMSFKLLKYINSAAFALPRKVESIQQAITYLGLAQVKLWVNILTMTSIADKPGPICQNILIRGKMCELLASQHEVDPSQLFLTGMLSALDCMLDMEMEEALEQLPIADEIKQAILNREGIAGEILSSVLNYERWELSNQNESQVLGALNSDIYLESINWTDEVLTNLQ